MECRSRVINADDDRGAHAADLVTGAKRGSPWNPRELGRVDKNWINRRIAIILRPDAGGRVGRSVGKTPTALRFALSIREDRAITRTRRRREKVVYRYEECPEGNARSRREEERDKSWKTRSLFFLLVFFSSSCFFSLLSGSLERYPPPGNHFRHVK